MHANVNDIIESVLSPFSYEQFFDNILDQKPLVLTEDNNQRESLAGQNPRQQLLKGFAQYAPNLTSHSYAPKGPAPKARAVQSPDAFRELIQEYFDAGYTVRIPDVTDLSDSLTLFTRALERQIQSAVNVVIFWSEQGGNAPIHHDEVDLIVIQLEGTKRWFISEEPPVLPNKWKSAGEKPPVMNNYHTVDVKPGDLIYLPRGTAHTVQSTSESIHVAIGFVPVTIRDAINAALDHYSELHKPLRMGLGPRGDCLTEQPNNPQIPEQIRHYLKRLSEACQDDAFIERALSRRKTRMIRELPKLPNSKSDQSITLTTQVKHHPLAMSELTVTEDILDFCQPGEQIFIHLGAQKCIEFIIKTPCFYVSDIPDQINDDVKAALVDRLVTSGFLVVDTKKQ
ncbi:cupin domain-containing protein [Idiomarina sp. HB]|uniref:JmjC domain-containing protein n=1 Tax=Idiomarina sp. HB TaxID=3110479 RepID=UPI003A80438D